MHLKFLVSPFFTFDDKELKKYGEEDVTVKNVIKYLAVLDSQLKPISRNFFTAPLSDDQKFHALLRSFSTTSKEKPRASEALN